MTTPHTTDFDVLIVGAGISGIGAAYHLKTFRPGTTFAVLEGRDSIGGTWDLHQYPGIRSDSDMPTFGYGFKPWTHRKAIADGHVILDYLQQTIDELALSRIGRGRHYLPTVGESGTTALVTSPGAAKAFASVAGPTWRNEVAARTALEVGLNRPTTVAARLTCPMLMQVGTFDDIAPAAAARRTANKAGHLAQLREYPIGHVEAFDGGVWQRQVLEDQVVYLSRALAP